MARLWLDATCVTLREGGRIISRAVTIAVAANEDGKRAVPGVATGPSEAFGRWPSPFWTGFLRSLADRGLRGVRLVIADDHKGLRAAARRVFNATHQRCRIHGMRNALAHAPARQRTAVAALLKTIFAQDTKVGAEAQWEIVADALREKQPRLGALMDSSRDAVPADMSFPREHRTRIASTNPPERVNREVKRRAGVIGVRPRPSNRWRGRPHAPTTRPSSFAQWRSPSARSPLCLNQWRTMAHCRKPATHGPSRGDT